MGLFGLRGKIWSVDEERQLRLLVEEGKGSGEISRIMGKTRVSIKAKLSNLGLHLKAAAGSGVQNSAATASAASSPAVSLPASESALAVKCASDSVVAAEADLKLKLPEKFAPSYVHRAVSQSK